MSSLSLTDSEVSGYNSEYTIQKICVNRQKVKLLNHREVFEVNFYVTGYSGELVISS